MASKQIIQNIYPLAPMQSGMLFHSLLHETSTAYFEQNLLRLEGKVDKDLLEKSIHLLIERYDILRTVFRVEKVKEPLQFVLAQRKFKLYFEDISVMSENEKQDYLEEFKTKDRERGFDLSRDLLVRGSLFKIGLNEYRLVWSFHHIIMDGWCLGIIYKDLIHIYCRLREGKPIELETVTPYVNYISWLKKQDRKAGLEFWQEYLEGYEGPAVLSKQDPLAIGDKYQVEKQRLSIDEERTILLKKMVSRYQVTINTLFQTLWAILLQKYNNNPDVVFGVVVSGRSPEIKGIENMVGLFINTIPVRIKTREEQEFSQLLRTIHEEAARLKQYEYLPLAEIQSNSLLKGNLINHAIGIENYPIREQLRDIGREQDPGFHIEHIDLYEQTNYHFNLIIYPGKRFALEFNYNAYIYENNFIKRVGQHLYQIIKQVIDNPHTTVKELEIITGEEKRRILEEFNDTAFEYPQDKTIHELFEEQAIRTPDGAAVIGMAQIIGAQHAVPLPMNHVSITYKELNKKSNRLAHMLRERGVQSDTIVGLMVERSIEMIIGMLGILKAGGAYLPVDLSYPAERINYMLEDSSARILVTEVSKVSEGTEVVSLGELSEEFPTHLTRLTHPTHPTHPTHLCYIIYTSGTTGRPKGVLIHHQGLVNMVWFHRQVFKEKPGSRISQVASPAFDALAFEVWPCLLGGAALHIVDNETRMYPRRFQEWLIQHQITISFQPTLMAQELLDQQWPETGAALEVLRTAGERLTRYPTRPYPFRFYNLYGPTEDTVWTTWTEVPVVNINVSKKLNLPPIGKPVANKQVYILSSSLKFQPVGVAGELCISGISLARGYLNRLELTAEKFIKLSQQASLFTTPYSPTRPLTHSTIYRTGDLARWLEDGNIEFIGRIDQQVKIRGYRIELGEIEAQLLAIDGIKEAAVIDRENKVGEQYLCGYIVSEAGLEIDTKKIKDVLSRTLPLYMIPGYFVQIDRIPLTANGKLDREKLPGPEFTQEAYTAPGNEIEEKLVEIWSEALGIEKEVIGIDTNFFDFGGNSLNIIKVNTKIKELFGKDILLTTMFRLGTIRDLAAFIQKEEIDLQVSDETLDKSVNVMDKTLSLLRGE